MPQSDTPQSSASMETTGQASTQSLKKRLALRLGKMDVLPELIGWQSIKRTMAHEDDLVRREKEAYHSLLHGDRASSPNEGDDMGHIVLGDMITHTHPPNNGIGKLAKAAVAMGALALGSGGIGAGAMVAINALDLLKDKAPEVRDRLIERESSENLEILPPVVREPQ